MQETQLEVTRSALGPAEVQELERQFSRQPTEEILRWAWERFGTRAAIGTSFQGAGLVMMHLAREHGLPFPVFTLDTGLLFPETVALKKRLEDYFGFKIESLEPDITVEEQADINGPELWKHNPDLCCTIRKVLLFATNFPSLTAGLRACAASNPTPAPASASSKSTPLMKQRGGISSSSTRWPIGRAKRFGIICTNTRFPTTLCRIRVIARSDASRARAELSMARTSARALDRFQQSRMWHSHFPAEESGLSNLMPANLVLQDRFLLPSRL